MSASATFRPALQLWSLREHVRADFIGSLDRIREWGVEAVELFPGASPLGAVETRDVLRERGLRAVGLHCLEKHLESPAERDALMEMAAVLEAEVVLAATPKRAFVDGASCAGFVRWLEETAGALSERGLRFSLHNHDWEFGDVGGEPALGRVLDGTAAADVGWELDTFHLWETGEDIEAWLRRFAPRCRLVHFKDGSAPGEAVYFGGGKIDFGATLRSLAQDGRTRVIVLEEGLYATDQYERVEASWRAFRRLVERAGQR